MNRQHIEMANIILSDGSMEVGKRPGIRIALLLSELAVSALCFFGIQHALTGYPG
jgi:hypothetical protein